LFAVAVDFKPKPFFLNKSTDTQHPTTAMWAFPYVHIGHIMNSGMNGECLLSGEHEVKVDAICHSQKVLTHSICRTCTPSIYFIPCDPAIPGTSRGANLWGADYEKPMRT
jgi:hypothetical protein